MINVDDYTNENIVEHKNSKLIFIENNNYFD